MASSRDVSSFGALETSEPLPSSSPTKLETAAESEEEYSALDVGDWAEDMGDGARQVCWQSLFPLLIGGMGSILAGIFLTLSARTELVQENPQFVAMVPPIQGMKGNLDMTFTSRLTTMAHQGHLDVQEGRRQRILYNIALLEGQAILFSLFVTLVSYLMDIIRRAPPGCAYDVFLYLGSVSVMAVAFSCCLMTLTMVGIVRLARRCKLNPDNLATPMASSLGDLLTIGLMIGFAYLLHLAIERHAVWICYVVIAVALTTVPGWFFVAWRDQEARGAAKSQWLTLMVAATIGSGAGALLEWANEQFPDITAYQPLISGIAGNRAVLMATRLSSNLNLHKVSYISFSSRLNPLSYFIFTRSKETRTARMLLLTSAFFQLVFVLITHLMASLIGPELDLTPSLTLGYLIAAFIQVLILIYLAQLIVVLLWKSGMDPDIHAIPIITAVGDVLGTGLLVGLFYILKEMYPTSGEAVVFQLRSNATLYGCSKS